MKIIREELQKNPDKVNMRTFLELAKKDERGIPQPNGIHTVKLLRGEEDERTNYKGILEEGIMLYFEEEGIEKKYFIAKFINDKNSDNYGKFHYLYERFADIEEGDELEMEYIRKGKTGYIDVRKVSDQEFPSESEPEISEEDIPIVEDENN